MKIFCSRVASTKGTGKMHLEIKTPSLRTTLLSGEDTKLARAICSVEMELLNYSQMPYVEARDLENFH